MNVGLGLDGIPLIRSQLITRLYYETRYAMARLVPGRRPWPRSFGDWSVVIGMTEAVVLRWARHRLGNYVSRGVCPSRRGEPVGSQQEALGQAVGRLCGPADPDVTTLLSGKWQCKARHVASCPASECLPRCVHFLFGHPEISLAVFVSIKFFIRDICYFNEPLNSALPQPVSPFCDFSFAWMRQTGPVRLLFTLYQTGSSLTGTHTIIAFFLFMEWIYPLWSGSC